MNQYRCRPEELPRNLYRVHYSESQTTRTDEGLKAADTTAFYSDSERERGLFKQAVEDHFTWGYRGRSPFVSLFSDRNHAEKWGCAEPWHGSNPHRKQWTLYTIDTSLLEEIYVFKVSRLVDALGVRIPGRAEQHERGSYICLHRVPARAILEESTRPANMKTGRNVRNWILTLKELSKGNRRMKRKPGTGLSHFRMRDGIGGIGLDPGPGEDNIGRDNGAGSGHTLKHGDQGSCPWIAENWILELSESPDMVSV